jgi:hypothetical protein
MLAVAVPAEQGAAAQTPSAQQHNTANSNIQAMHIVRKDLVPKPVISNDVQQRPQLVVSFSPCMCSAS